MYFEQENSKDESVLLELTKCFGLFYTKGYHAKGLHEGILRLVAYLYVSLDLMYTRGVWGNRRIRSEMES